MVSPYMRRALDLARSALGTTSPNPSVGAVLVREGEVVGEGFTHPPGGPHAEIVALRQAGERARGAVLYVTLEPCPIQGRTAPCVPAILQAGVQEVHFPVLDPNPLINGRGKEALERAGIRVVVGEGAEEARELMEGHFKWITTHLPFVTAKFAMTLDGKMATSSGESRWLTGELARRLVHRLRQTSDAVMVGSGTALRDDPLLTARDPEGHPLPRQPLRVVADSRGRLPPRARLFSQPGRVLIAVASISPERQRALEEAGAEVVSLPGEDGRVDLRALLRLLGEREVTTLLVEGGGTLLASFFAQGLVDKVVAFLAPLVLGGREAPTPAEGPGVPRLADAPRWEVRRVERVGEDLMVVAYPRRGE